MADQLQVDVSATSDSVAVAAVRGELDAATSTDFERQLTGARTGSASVKVVIADLSEVDFIDSAGMGAILRAWKSLSLDGIKLGVVSPKPRINRLFEITGLDQTFSVKPTLAEALLDLGADGTE
jgi:anti-sigma B factor antagonist